MKQIYTKKKYIKGVSFPTCISLNEVVGNFTPLTGEDYADAKGIYLTIKENDVVKVDLGVQIQGFSANVAHTVVAHENPTEVTKGRAADAILAAYHGLHAALRQMYEKKHTNYHATESIKIACEEYGVEAVEGFGKNDRRYGINVFEAVKRHYFELQKRVAILDDRYF